LSQAQVCSNHFANWLHNFRVADFSWIYMADATEPKNDSGIKEKH
ncbi:hypothetical protein SAMN05443667_115133, partial [Flavobacterium gillisiae]